jgi:apolipoprotein N-acyltransferase
VQANAWPPLCLAIILLPVANGVHALGLAGWLAPLFLLRVVRLRRPIIGLSVAYVLLAGAFAIQFRGAIPLSGAAYGVLVAVEGAVSLISYVVDRVVVSRLSGTAATLVFPCTWVAVEYLNSFSPFGTWGAAAYSQAGNLPLMQLLSVTGLWGITFLMAWFAAVANAVWQKGLKETLPAVLACGATLALVFLLGGLRIVVSVPVAPSVRVASLSEMDVGGQRSGDADYWRRATIIDNDLLQRAGREMEAGAKIVFWGEANAPVLKSNEAAFVARGQALAAVHHAYFAMSLYVVHGGHPSPFDDNLVLIGSDGRIVWEYEKSKPVPGTEAALMVRGDGRLKAAQTPYGRISGIICFDGDFPRLVAQAGKLRADILLDASNDWPAIDPLHTQMASFRAVEQGVNLVRQTSHGLSAAFDYEGRELAVMDHYHTTDHVMVAEVPTRGVRTLYARFGDWFAWVSVAGILLLSAFGCARLETSR